MMIAGRNPSSGSDAATGTGVMNWVVKPSLNWLIFNSGENV
jgi:hypothetical protein